MEVYPVVRAPKGDLGPASDLRASLVFLLPTYLCMIIVGSQMQNAEPQLTPMYK